MKAQTALGLVILGVVTIIAVIGLVLLFTRAGTEGAAILQNPQQHIAQQVRTPAFIINGGYANLYYLPSCERSLQLAGIPVPHNQFNCFVLPNRIPASNPGEYYYGGQRGEAAQSASVACYANSVSIQGTEADIRDLVLNKLVKRPNKDPEMQWGSTMINNEEVPVCWVSKQVLPAP